MEYDLTKDQYSKILDAFDTVVQVAKKDSSNPDDVIDKIDDAMEVVEEQAPNYWWDEREQDSKKVKGEINDENMVNKASHLVDIVFDEVYSEEYDIEP